MKKRVVLSAVIMLLLVSCSKKDWDTQNNSQMLPSITFKKDSSVVNGAVQVPATRVLIFAVSFNTGGINAFQLTNITVQLKGTGDATSPSRYLRNIRAEVFGGAETPYLTEVKDSVIGSEFSFANFLRNFPQYQTRYIRIYADVVSVATNGIGLPDELTVSVKLTYVGLSGVNIATGTTDFIAGHTTTFTTVPPVFSVASYADSTNPVGGVMIESQPTECLRYAVGLNGQSGAITSHRFVVQGQGSSAVTTLKLYSAGSFIAQATVSSGIATITTNDPVIVGTRKFYAVVPVLSVAAPSSNYDFTVTLDEAKAVSTAGETKTDLTDRTSNSFTVLKSQIVMTSNAVPTTIVNSSVMTIADVSFTAVGGSGALKQYALSLTLNDQGIDDTLFIKGFQLFDETGANVTTQFRFTDAAGVVDTMII